MSTTARARQLFADRKLAAKWVLARRYINQRGLPLYPQMLVPPRLIQPTAH
jgi:hypothetical protein